jgi:penicillin-binding protein 1A
LLKKIFLGVGLLILGGLSIISYDFYTTVSTRIDELLEHDMDISSEIFDRNGNKIANIVSDEYRLYVKYNDIPSRIIEALLAIEDTSFFEHDGINIEAIFRAAIKDVIAMEMVEGASTITQQFVRNAILTRDKTILRKLKEVVLAYEVEKHMSKEMILEQYLNKIYFGRGYHGIRTASKGYFHKELNALTLKEMAILIGLIKAPSFYDPTKNLEQSVGRANRVLDRMYSGLGWITKSEYEEAIKEEIKPFRTTKTQNVAPYIVDEVLRRVSSTVTKDELKKGGYKIDTTIDLQLHEIMTTALRNGHKNIIEKLDKRGVSESEKKKLNGAAIVLNPHSGEILSMVGGVSYKESVFNRVTQGERQIGSSIKPFIYQTAINYGFSGASILYDVQKTYEYIDGEGNEQKWRPQNYSKKVKGTVSLRDALVFSKNLATISLVESVGAGNIYNALVNYGFKTISRNLSTSLGSYSTSMLNLAHLYTTIANGGTRVKPILVSSVKSKSGDEVYKDDREEVTIDSPQQNYLMVDIMKDVVHRTWGSGRRARTKGLDIAGKTGTTNYGKDVWFNSFSPTHQVHVWFGKDDNTPIVEKKAGEKKIGIAVAGGVMSAPVAGEFFQELLKLEPYVEREFKMPIGINRFKFNGKFENFTDISKPPLIRNEIVEESESLIF